MNPTAARARTLAHMRRVLAGATVAAAGCSHETAPPTTVVLPAAPPASVAAASADAGAPAPSGTAVAAASASARRVTPNLNPLTTHPMMGSDPVPPPSYCPGVGKASKASGRLLHDAAGTLVELTVSLPASGPNAATFSAAGQPSAAQPPWSVLPVTPDGPTSHKMDSVNFRARPR